MLEKIDLDKLKFLTAMVWIGLIGAALILVVDYQIKHSILDHSRRTWEALDRLDRGVHVRATEKRADNSDRHDSSHASANGAGHGTPVEMGTVGQDDLSALRDTTPGTE